MYATNSVGTAYGTEYSITTSANMPSVTTHEVTEITSTTAVGGGEVIDDGGATVTDRGICWSTSHNPTTGGSHASSGTGMGSFTVEMTSLTPSTTYYVRAYAHNSAGTAYSDEVSFTTAAAVPGDEFIVDFESGMPAGWTTIDADGDGYNWGLGSVALQGSGNGHGGSSDMACSSSYNNFGVLYPDNYLVSPQVNLAAGSILSFYACAQDESYASEHFGVAISDNGTSNWTMVQEWTMTAKSGGKVMTVGRGGNTRQGNWYLYTVDLSAYVGQKYIAIRHFNCSDQFYLDVDDIELSNAKK